MGAISDKTAPTSFAERYLVAGSQAAFVGFSVSVVALVMTAWVFRGHRYVQAESGAGYLLGITGVIFMLVLLIYPVRKRWPFLQQWMSLGSWFRLHMLLGVLGPVCIILHANFRLGSANSSVALVAMLLVAGSGLIGRYLYGKFHYGLYGRQVELQQLSQDLDTCPVGIDKTLLTASQLAELDSFMGNCKQIVSAQQQRTSLSQLIGQRRWLRKARPDFLQADKATLRLATHDHAALVAQVKALEVLLDRLASVRLCERLFNVWHVVHVPVFVLMVVTAVVHVLVVHWY